MPLSEGKIKHLNALSNKKGVIAAAAMDQRGSLAQINCLRQRRSTGQVTDDMMERVQGRGFESFDAACQRHPA